MTIPEKEKILLEIPLYEEIKFVNEDLDSIFDLLLFDGTVDSYCPTCDEISIFKGVQDQTNYRRMLAGPIGSVKRMRGEFVISKFLGKIHQVNFICTRNKDHLMQFSFLVQDGSIIKVGQYPSIAETSQPKLKKYRNVLSNEKYKELNRGVGLITHGVGIGAYVYLRRIFEHLIEEAHLKRQALEDWDENSYQNSRMDKKIELLKTELPKFLVLNKELYSILSLGIHELSEDNCLEYFPTVRLAVELILDEKFEEKIREDKIKLASKSISKLHGDLRKK